MKQENRPAPEIARYTKYYEHDGMLRAYANRSMLLAMIFGMLAMAIARIRDLYSRYSPPRSFVWTRMATPSSLPALHPFEPRHSAASVDPPSADGLPNYCSHRYRRPRGSTPISHSISGLYPGLGGPQFRRSAQHDDRQFTVVHHEPASR